MITTDRLVTHISTVPATRGQTVGLFLRVGDPEVCNAMWRELMALDEVGARRGPNGEGIMRAPNRMNFGWRRNLALIAAPTLVVLGEFAAGERGNLQARDASS